MTEKKQKNQKTPKLHPKTQIPNRAPISSAEKKNKKRHPIPKNKTKWRLRLSQPARYNMENEHPELKTNNPFSRETEDRTQNTCRTEAGTKKASQQPMDSTCHFSSWRCAFLAISYTSLEEVGVCHQEDRGRGLSPGGQR